MQFQPKLRFNPEKLRDLAVAHTFQATISWKFTPLIGLRDEDMDMNTMITTQSVRYLGMTVTGKSQGSPEMFSTL